jgi:hypothetical protein
MRTSKLTGVVAFAIAAAIGLSVATPTFAKVYPYGGARGADYIYSPGDIRCYSDEGYGRRSSCDGASN